MPRKERLLSVDRRTVRGNWTKGLMDMSSLLLLVVVVGLGIWLSNRSTPQRDAAAAHSWANFHHYTATNGWQLLEIHSRYEDWSQGSKAYVSIYGAPTGIIRDAWFWWHHVQPGSMVAVRGFGEGWDHTPAKTASSTSGTETYSNPVSWPHSAQKN